ncbi:protein of unknown function [Methanoculleus bourgensis]|uniref:Uncharacterized protein n=1 Tax=Methanoculleus bourgensis TaxID=83986 RepID=A0A0X3BQ36_9EURY|nr:protein of unknown function [Methanoculleus bourgensis]
MLDTNLLDANLSSTTDISDPGWFLNLSNSATLAHFLTGFNSRSRVLLIDSLPFLRERIS